MIRRWWSDLRKRRRLVRYLRTIERVRQKYGLS